MLADQNLSSLPLPTSQPLHASAWFIVTSYQFLCISLYFYSQSPRTTPPCCLLSSQPLRTQTSMAQWSELQWGDVPCLSAFKR